MASSVVNHIRKKIVTSSVSDGSRDIAIAVATLTDLWQRPEQVVRQQGPAIKKAVEQNEHLIKEGTVEIVARYERNNLYCIKSHTEKQKGCSPCE